MSKEEIDKVNKKDLEDHLPQELQQEEQFEGNPDQADESSNPLQDEGTVTFARELMDDVKRLHAKSILTVKEADVFAKLIDKSEYHVPMGSLGRDKYGKLIVPSLLRFVQNELKMKMSIGGITKEQLVRPYGDQIRTTRKKTLKERVVS